MFALIGLSTFWDVMTPAKLCQRTVFDVWANAEEAPSNRHKLASTFFILLQSFFVLFECELLSCREVWPATCGRLRKSGREKVEVSVAFWSSFGNAGADFDRAME